MPSGNIRLYLLLGMLALFVALPVVKSVLQEASLGQDIRSIQMEYSMFGREKFRSRLTEILKRAPLDPDEVQIRMQEDEAQGKVLIEIRYVSRMKILFYPFERQVVVRRDIPFVSM